MIGFGRTAAKDGTTGLQRCFRLALTDAAKASRTQEWEGYVVFQVRFSLGLDDSFRVGLGDPFSASASTKTSDIRYD